MVCKVTQETTCNCCSKIEEVGSKFADRKALTKFLVRLWVDMAVAFVLVGGLFFQGDWSRLVWAGVILAVVGLLLPVIAVGVKKR